MLRDAPGTAPSFTPPSVSSPNYFRMLWQRKLLLVLGMAVGAGIGYWHNSQQPPVYRSSAKFQLVKPYTKHMPVQGVDAADFGDSSSEQIMVMRSERVLTRAAELGKLDEIAPFAGLPANQIGPMLSGSSDFTVRDIGKTIYEISYTGDSPDVTLSVLQAVSDAYAEHLAEQQSIMGKETLALIDQARGGVLERLESLEQQLDKFRQETPLVYRNGEMGSIHRDYADRYLSQRQELVIRGTQISSKLKAAEEAMRSGESTESILLLLGGDVQLLGSDAQMARTVISTNAANKSSVTNNDEKKKPDAEIAAAVLPEEMPMPNQSRAEFLRSDTLFPLELQEQELLKEVGENHPTVAALRSKKRMIQAQIDRIAASEKEYNQQLQEYVKQRDEQAIALQQELAGEVGTETPEEREARAEERRQQQVRLLVLAMKQQQKLIDHETAVITEAYEHETNAMHQERAAEIELERLTREISRQQALYDRIVSRLDEVSIASESGGLRIVALESPKLGRKVTVIESRSVLLGLILGLGSMVGLCLLLGLSDKSYHSAEEIAEHLRSPVIGHIPFVSKSKFRNRLQAKEGSLLDETLHTFHHPKNSSSEAYKSVRTALFFSNQGGDRKVLQVTSAAPAEGKSTIAANIAISIAQSGKSVLLVDADLRRPKVQKLFGNEAEKGLAWAVERLQGVPRAEMGFELIAEAVHETEVQNLSMVGAGTKPQNPAELLSSHHFEAFLDLVKEKFDIVILDSPPLLAVTDPSNIAPRVDGVIMVIRLGKQTRPRAAQAIRMLETLSAEIVGVVVNAVGSKDSGYYGRYGGRDGYYNSRYYRDGYGYTYGYAYGYRGKNKYGEYYDDDEKKGKKKKKPEPSESTS